MLDEPEWSENQRPMIHVTPSARRRDARAPVDEAEGIAISTIPSKAAEEILGSRRLG